MNNIKRISAALICICILTLYVPLSGLTGAVYADSTTRTKIFDEYTASYTIRVYSGREGYFDDDKTRVKVYDGLNYGESVTIDLSELGLNLTDPEKYYIRGLTVAGHDNDEAGNNLIRSYTFKVTEDRSYTAVYGIASDMVKYTVRYIDQDGNELRSSEEFFGMAGDRPVVAYKYIEGYSPLIDNEVRTLVSDEPSNVYEFVYERLESEKNESPEEPGGNENPGKNEEPENPENPSNPEGPGENEDPGNNEEPENPDEQSDPSDNNGNNDGDKEPDRVIVIREGGNGSTAISGSNSPVSDTPSDSDGSGEDSDGDIDDSTGDNNTGDSPTAEVDEDETPTTIMDFGKDLGVVKYAIPVVVLAGLLTWLIIYIRRKRKEE